MGDWGIFDDLTTNQKKAGGLLEISGYSGQKDFVGELKGGVGYGECFGTAGGLGGGGWG